MRRIFTITATISVEETENIRAYAIALASYINCQTVLEETAARRLDANFRIEGTDFQEHGKESVFPTQFGRHCLTSKIQ